MQAKRGLRHLTLDIIQAQLTLLFMVYLKVILSASEHEAEGRSQQVGKGRQWRRATKRDGVTKDCYTS